jgi:hypothetical protein
MYKKEIINHIELLDEIKFTTKPIKGRISDENYTKIGRIIGLFQRLENSIAKNISLRIGGNAKLNDCVIVELSFNGLIKSLQSLFS